MSEPIDIPQELIKQQELIEYHYDRGARDALLSTLRGVRKHGVREGVCCVARTVVRLDPDNVIAVDTLKELKEPAELTLDGLAVMVGECFGRQLHMASKRIDETEDTRKLKHLADVITQLTLPL